MTSTSDRHAVPVAAAAPQPRFDNRLAQWWRRAFLPFWVVPALWCLGAVLAGVLLPQVEQSLGTLPVAVASEPDGARSVLSTIAGAMISVTGLVFSITIVVLQLASSQFTPRVLRSFLDDRVTQNTLGVFAASFLYALTVLRAVHSGESADAVPQLAVSVGFVLVLAAVAMFLAFIHHITSSIAVESVIGRVSQECRDLLDGRLRPEEGLTTEPVDLPDLPFQHVITAPRSGYLDSVDRVRLCRIASRRAARLEVLHPLGTFVPVGAPLVMAHLDHAADRDGDWDLASAVVLATERSAQQDLSFGFRRLVDIAERALSPGVNDPTTAVQVIDRLHDLLRRMSVVADVYPVTSDEEGVPRVITRELGYADYLALAVEEIAHYGRDSVQVPRRLTGMLTDLATVAHDDRRAAVRSALAHPALTS